ncbi:lipopolysaccharide assembly protein LapA domain-containing protein [Comamonadaceae bacterium M7527]|nr:lipopolysaccharide assembly protein LapA domain-containing protein [Comamonadaceae bacterium M7527]
MKIVFWFVRIVVFVAVLAFALNNQHVIDLYLLPGSTWHLPLVWAITGAFVLGCLFGVLAMLPLWMRARKLAQQQVKQQPKTQTNQVAGGVPAITNNLPATQPTRGISNDELGV